MDYDVLILGGGMLGCAIAYELSKYSLNIALIEKKYDIADDISIINSSIVYSGLECEDELMNKMESIGNSMFDEITKKFNVPFKRMGSLILARNEEEERNIDTLYERAIKRGIDNVAILSPKHTYEMEKNLNVDVKKAMYSKNAAIVSPYDLAIAYGEVAFDNDVNFKLEEEVENIEKISKGFKVITNKNKFTCKIVINTIPVKNYSIDLNNNDNNIKYKSFTDIKYLILDKSFNMNLTNILVFLNNNNTINIHPTLQGSTVISMYGKGKTTYDDFMLEISKIIENIDSKYINNFYKENFYEDKVLIDDSQVDDGYIKILGKRYSIVTMAPFIAKNICETIINNTGCKEKKNYHDKRREFYRFKDLSDEERKKIIKLDARYGKMICVCNNISEGEIIDSIRRPLGARTIEGVKRRTGASFGSCQGSYCLGKIISILARETNKKLTDIVKSSKDSKVFLNRIKEFDEM